MSVATYRHDKLSTEKGVSIFIIRMPFQVTRKMKGLQFVDGTAYTKFPAKAQEFDELFGYEVVLPKGYKVWENASSKRAVTAADPGDEDYVDTGEEPDEMSE